MYYMGYQTCYDPGYAAPYPYPRFGYGNFPLIVVLFILLIIIGTSCFNK